MHYFRFASFCILIAQLIVQPDHWEGDVLNRFVVILTDLSSARHYTVDSWQLLSVNFSSLALISMYVLCWKAIQHVQPEYFSKKTTCLTGKGERFQWNGRSSLESGSVIREKSIRKGETVKEQRKEKMKKKKSRAERWTPSRLASLSENLLIPPPRPHYCRATTFAVFCIPLSFEAIWIGFAILY